VPHGGGSWPKDAYPEAYARDGLVCRYCGSANATRYQMDHVIPRQQGGGHGADNIVVACQTCNVRKGGRTPAEAGMVLRPSPKPEATS
jgi:5-methylcytosine-specific restriction endonuclease McrA